VIQDDAHLLLVLRYIEANPLRAKMVSDPAEYRWSSYSDHGLRRDDPLLSPFPEWEVLRLTEAERRRRWRAKVCSMQTEAELTRVRGSLRNGRPFGTSEWTERMAERLHVELIPRPKSRPRNEK
jgi:putative transposase